MKKVKLILVVAVAAIIGAGIFYACQKEPIQELNAHETRLEQETHKPQKEMQRLPKYYKEEDCTISEEHASHRGIRCQNSSFKVERACASGHPCKKVGSGDISITGHIATKTYEMKIPEMSEYFYKITFDILRDHKTDEARALCNLMFNFVNHKSLKVTRGWIMHLALTDRAIAELKIFIEKGDKKRQKEIISAFDSYTLFVDGELLTPDFSKIIYLEDDKFVLNYEHIKKETWKYLIRYID